jgi:hypothetical protein
VWVDLRYFNRRYQLRAGLRSDVATSLSTAWTGLADLGHFIELYWRASTAPGANNGSLILWIDGVQTATLSGVDNDTTRIERIRLGAVSGIDSGTRGTYYFDAFEARRLTYIGP